MAAVFAAAEQPFATPVKATAAGAAARDAALGCAARLGTLAHAANVVVNQTMLSMVFGQLGTQETLTLPPRRECGYAWRVGVGAGGAIEGEDAADVGNLWAEACGMSAATSAASAATHAAGAAAAAATEAEAASLRSLRFRLADDFNWSETVALQPGGPFGSRWLAVGPPDDYVLLRLHVESAGLQLRFTLGASHLLVNRLDLPLLVRLYESSLPAAPALRLPPGADVPLVLRFSRHAMRTHAIRVTAAPHTSTRGAKAVPPPSAPPGAALLPVPLPPMGGGRGKQSGEATQRFTRLVPEPDAPTDDEQRCVDLGTFSFSTFADPTDDAAASRLIFAPFVRLVNPSFATHLSYHVERLGGDSAERRSLRHVHSESLPPPLTLEPGAEAPLLGCGDVPGVWLRLQPAGHTWCDPPLQIDAASLPRAEAGGAPVLLHCKTAEGQALCLHAHLRRCEPEEGAVIEVVLLAPLEVLSRAAHPLLLHCSLEHSHVLSLPVARGDGGYGCPTALCSWGVTQDARHKYVVRLAVTDAEEAGEDAGGDARVGGKGGTAPRAWSEFVPVERSLTLSLAHPDGEHALLYRLTVSTRVSCGITHRLVEISPALYLHSHARLPLRVSVCGFPFFHSFRPRGGSAPVALERWMREVGSREAAGRVSPLLRMTVCVDGAELAAAQLRARARRRRVAVEKEGGGGQYEEEDDDDDDDHNDDEDEDDAEEEEDDDEDEDEDEWDWSGELSLEADEVGRRQRVCLQSEGGRLRLLACELSVDGSGVLHASLFDDPQPPLTMLNHTHHTIFLSHAPAPSEAPSAPIPAHEVLKLASGRTGHFFFGRRSHAVADNTPSSALSEAVLLLGLHPDMVAELAVPGTAALRLAPPRVLSLRLLPPRTPAAHGAASLPFMEVAADPEALQPLDVVVAISQHGPTCTLRLLPAATAARPIRAVAPCAAPPTDVSAVATIGRLSLCLWAERGLAAANAAVAPAITPAEAAAAAQDGAAALNGGGAPAHRLKGGPLLHLSSKGLECSLHRSVQPTALPELLRHKLQHEPASSTATSLQITLQTVQLDSWGSAAAAPRVVLCGETVPQWGSTAAAAAPRRTASRVSLITSQYGAAPAHLQLAEVRLLPLSLTLDDLLIARITALAEASAVCARRTHAALQADGGPHAVTNGAGGVGHGATPLGIPRAARAPPPLLYIARLCVSEVSVTLSAHTSRLGPLSVSTRHTPLTFSALSLTATLGSPAALGAALLGRYGAEALAQSAALVGSLQLLGNPTRLLRLVGAGLTDALQLPLRGLSEGPRQFVAGLGAGGASLLLHVSHGALTSVSDFTAAIAANLGVEASAPLSQPPPPPPKRRQTTLASLGGGLLAAVSRPVGSALHLVSHASQSLMQSVGGGTQPVAMPLPPRPRGWHGGFTSEEWLCRKVLPLHEAYWGHVAATPVASRLGGVSHVLLLSSAALYVIQPFARRAVLMTLPMHQVCAETRTAAAPSTT